jgi:hypothetical protein
MPGWTQNMPGEALKVLFLTLFYFGNSTMPRVQRPVRLVGIALCCSRSL